MIPDACAPENSEYGVATLSAGLPVVMYAVTALICDKVIH
jgi:hypothetical protein